MLLQFGDNIFTNIFISKSVVSSLETCNCAKLQVFWFLKGKYLGYNYTSLVFAPYGDHWRNLRRVCSLEIVSSYRLREFEPTRACEVRLMMRKLYRSSSEKPTVIKVKNMLVDLTLNIVMRMISGKRYYYSKDDVLTEEEKKKANLFQEIVAEIFKVMGATNVGDFVPILRWLGVRKLEKRLINLQTKRDLFMHELMDELKVSMKDCTHGKKERNMIQMLFSLQESEPECYTDEMIRSIMLVTRNCLFKIFYLCILRYNTR